MLIYQDVRKFGKFYLTKKDSASQLPELKKLGVEPTKSAFQTADFYSKLQKKQSMIKPLLMNQEIVAGLGNIYTDEVLWQAKIHPKEVANLISQVKVEKLHDAIIETLELATKFLGTTVNTFTNAHGEMGQFQQFLKVYGRSGKPCERCQTIIEKIKVGGRGTHFCPHCQKKSKGISKN
jgi:formamidopyrimidine-DNA glycosylase